MSEIKEVVLVVVNLAFCLQICSPTTCYDGSEEEVNVIYGQGFSLRCNSTLQCYLKLWENSTNGLFLALPSNETMAPFSGSGAGLFEVQIHRVTLFEAAIYTCQCHQKEVIPNVGNGVPICSVKVTTICRAKVVLNGKTTTYYSNSQSLSDGNLLSVTKDDEVTVECQREAQLQSNCPIRIDPKEDFTKASINATETCHVSCIITQEARTSSKSCLVYIIVRLLKSNNSEQSSSFTTAATTSSNTEIFTEFRSLLPSFIIIIGVVCILALVVVALGAYIIFSRCQTRYTSQEISHSYDLSHGVDKEDPSLYDDENGDTNYPISRENDIIVGEYKNEPIDPYYIEISDDTEGIVNDNETSAYEEASYSHTIY